ncbi:MAG: hypothetical protein IKS55_11600 [Oscillospiraceae bacterium]|nr:hypothetical protein [Oscillospiraceae bacterium]
MPAPAPQPIQHRPRINQPLGFLIAGTRRPTYYYGRRHDYVYYPESWVDESTGTSYEKGYYDENGQYYENVAFEKNGRYENVVCHCPYCDRETILNLDAGDEAMKNLECPHCGGTMEIRSELDDVLNQQAENTHVYNSAESLEHAFRNGNQATKKKKKTWPWVVGALAAIILFRSIGSGPSQKPQHQTGTVEPLTITESSGTNASAPVLLGDTLYLNSAGGNVYTYAPSGAKSGDKVLQWYNDYDCYYDAASDCYLGYNNDARIWQYWYEGISSDYGDYGWMEHYDDGWFIEATQGNWVALPSGYDVSRLWYIA